MVVNEVVRSWAWPEVTTPAVTAIIRITVPMWETAEIVASFISRSPWLESNSGDLHVGRDHQQQVARIDEVRGRSQPPLEPFASAHAQPQGDQRRADGVLRQG